MSYKTFLDIQRKAGECGGTCVPPSGFAWLVREEFPDYDMNRVMELALFHDMGEALTGDIPAFEKDKEDEKRKNRLRRRLQGCSRSHTGRDLQTSSGK